MPDGNLDKNEQSFFDSYYAEQLYNPAGWRLRLEREKNNLLSIAQSAGVSLGRVLSLGCGDGQFELLLAPFAKEVVGVDLSPEAINIARKAADSAGIHNVRFECASVYDAHWDDEFDTAVVLAFLHHVPESEMPSLLRRLFASLRPNGLIYTSDPNKKALLRKVGRLTMGDSYDKYHSPDERELDPSELQTIIKDVGFCKVSLYWPDFTLIPALFVLAKGPSWPLYLCKVVDAILSRTPLRPWSSTFALAARKP